MKTMILICSGIALLSAGAAMADQPSGRELLAVTKFVVSDGLTVDLATYRLPEGAVCQEYVNSAKHTGAKWWATKAEFRSPASPRPKGSPSCPIALME